MKHTAVATLIFALLVGFALYIFVWKGEPSSFTVNSPQAETVWQPGEERTISWNAAGVPDDYKISVAIERIPPPPLEEEGQEFDPIIFTDLPNTGSTTWEISSMYPVGTYVLRLHAYESLPITGGLSAVSETFIINHPELSVDTYPLYDNANWQFPEVEQVAIGSINLSGASVTSHSISADMDPANIFTQFESYYEEKLTRLGWTVANDLTAGGPTGGQTGYTKDERTILIRYHIDFHNLSDTGPVECPCDATLSVFSGE